jgi:hypothetical protein
VSADLEKPTADGWTQVAGSSILHVPIPFRKQERIVQNRP